MSIPTLDFLKPRTWNLIGKGGEHLVFQWPDESEWVIKVSMPYLSKVIAHHRKHQQAISQLPKPFAEAAKFIIPIAEKRHATLATYFPTQVLAQQMVLTRIPMLPEIAERWVLTATEQQAEMLYALVTVQQYEPRLAEGSFFSLSTGHAEANFQIPGFYRQVNQRYLYHYHPQAGFSADKFFKVQRTSALRKLVRAAEQNANLKRCLKELVGTMIRYAEATDELPDLSPKNNLIIYEDDDGEWQHRMIDVHYPLRTKGLALAWQLMQQLQAGQTLSQGKRGFLRSAVNVVRTLNALADFCCEAERIHLGDATLSNDPTDLLPILSELGPEEDQAPISTQNPSPNAAVAAS